MPKFTPKESNVKRSVVVFGPKGSGKTFNSKAIADRLGLERVVEWDDMQQRARGVGHFGILYLCQEIPMGLHHFPCYSITEFTSINGKFYLGANQLGIPPKIVAAVVEGESFKFGEEAPFEVEKTLSIQIGTNIGRLPDRLVISSATCTATEYRKVEKPKPPFEIIGITGKKRSGKDTLADALVKKGYKKLSFAAPMKYMLQVLLGHIEDDKKEEILPEFGVSYRHMAQTLGTEWGRNKINPDMWVKLLERKIRPGGKYVVSDVRFDNEADFIRKSGGLLIHVERSTGRVDPHSSESGVTWALMDTLINNHYSNYEEYKLFCDTYAESLSKYRSQT